MKGTAVRLHSSGVGELSTSSGAHARSIAVSMLPPPGIKGHRGYGPARFIKPVQHGPPQSSGDAGDDDQQNCQPSGSLLSPEG